MTQSRSDWCISRQRTWGVPIPVFYHRDTDEVLLNDNILAHAKALIAEHGTDIWWSSNEAELLPPQYASIAANYVKGTDTMDVWFDSGSSWAAVAKQRGLAYPVDLYLEGSDQHRGWFQSSLLTSVAVNGVAPYKGVLTHGFVLDEKGYKMSKSLGNVIDPRLVIEGGANKKKQPGYGADVLRLWVASVNYASDVCIGDAIIKQCFESYRKLRNTARYLLGSLHDFDPSVHAVPHEQLPALDQYMLSLTASFLANATREYNEYAFNRVYSLLQHFAVADLSNFYLDIAKDRLYIASSDEFRRRSCQTVMAQLLSAFTAVLAPIMPHMAEDIWQHLPYAVAKKSVFEAGWPSVEGAGAQEEHASWEVLRSLRDVVNKVLEEARSQKTAGSSLETKLLLHTSNPALNQTLSALGATGNDVDNLRYLFLVSQVELVQSDEAVSMGATLGSRYDETLAATVGLAPADGVKCERCWNYCTSVGASSAYAGVCERCDAALSRMSFPPVAPDALAFDEVVDAAAPTAPARVAPAGRVARAPVVEVSGMAVAPDAVAEARHLADVMANKAVRARSEARLKREAAKAARAELESAQ